MNTLGFYIRILGSGKKNGESGCKIGEFGLMVNE